MQSAICQSFGYFVVLMSLLGCQVLRGADIDSGQLQPGRLEKAIQGWLHLKNTLAPVVGSATLTFKPESDGTSPSTGPKRGSERKEMRFWITDQAVKVMI